MSKWTFMNDKVSHWPWSKVAQIQTFSNFFCLEIALLFEAKFHMEPLWDGRMKVYVTWPRLPPCPYMVKTFKNLLLWNQKTDELETWCVALDAQVLPNLSKWWPWVDLDLFYSKVKFGPFCFCMGKCLNCRFPRNYWSLWGWSRYI